MKANGNPLSKGKQEFNGRVKVKGEEIDFTRALPLTGRDKQALKKLGIDFEKAESWEDGEEKAAAIAAYFAKKAQYNVEADDFLDLPLRVLLSVVTFLTGNEDADKDFLVS